VWDQIGTSRPGYDGLALGVAVKPHAFGVPPRFQGLTAPPRQARKELMPCLPEKRVSRQSEPQNVLTLSERSNADFPTLALRGLDLIPATAVTVTGKTVARDPEGCSCRSWPSSAAVRC
jgi:hypothetical protein